MISGNRGGSSSRLRNGKGARGPLPSEKERGSCCDRVSSRTRGAAGKGAARRRSTRRRGEKKKAKSNEYGPLSQSRVVKDTGVTTRARIQRLANWKISFSALSPFSPPHFFAPALSLSLSLSLVLIPPALSISFSSWPSTHERFTSEVKDTRPFLATFIPKRPFGETLLYIFNGIPLALLGFD